MPAPLGGAQIRPSSGGEEGGSLSDISRFRRWTDCQGDLVRSNQLYSIFSITAAAAGTVRLSMPHGERASTNVQTMATTPL